MPNENGIETLFGKDIESLDNELCGSDGCKGAGEIER
jgi:hypothetical protein